MLNGSDDDIVILNEPVDAILSVFIVVDRECYVDVAIESRFTES